MVLRPYLPLASKDRDPGPRLPPPVDLEARAREYLAALGHADHPDARTNPLYALYQVAVDYRCTAHGYRALYFRREDARD